MLIDITVTNFRSIKTAQSISFARATGDELLANSFEPQTPSTVPLLKSLAINGANAAGKSNVLSALETVREIVLYSARNKQMGDKFDVIAFAFADETVDEPSEFEINFVYQNVRYQYGFCITQTQVLEEWLFAYPKGRPQRWFARVYDKEQEKSLYKFGDSLTGQKFLWQQATRENALFLSTAVQLNSEQLKPVFQWFKDVLVFSGPTSWMPDQTVQLCDSDSAMKAKVVEFLQAADLAIDDVKIKKSLFNLNQLGDELPYGVREVAKQYGGTEVVEQIQAIHKMKTGKLVPLDLEDESDGTRRLFAFAGPWINALVYGRIFVVDELHDSLHPKLVEYLVKLFHNEKTNPHNAQLIFTTHETSILNQSIFRRDQIWFCEKNDEQATELYSLVEFSPRKGRDNLESGYLSGRYGALPLTGGFVLE